MNAPLATGAFRTWGESWDAHQRVILLAIKPSNFERPRAYSKNVTPNIALRDRAPESYFRRQFRTRRPSVVCEMSAISRRLERDLIPHALETDCPLVAAGFEPPHIRIGICQDSQPGRRDSNLRISN
jgi:hypothetical protein